jgi:hypothetical protein
MVDIVRNSRKIFGEWRGVTAMKVQEIKMEGEFTNSTKKLGYSK